MGFKEGLSDSSLFILDIDEIRTFLLVYVDNIVVTSSSIASIDQVVGRLATEFAVKDLGPLKFFLGIHVARSAEGIFLSQQQYVSNLLHDENLGHLKPTSSPMEPKVDLTDTTTTALNMVETTRYRRILGSLQYLTNTCPNISYTMSKFSQFFF